MDPIEQLRLSRRLEALARAEERALWQKRAGQPWVDPFSGGLFPGKSLFDELSELHPSDPLRAPLLAHVFRLVVDRVQSAWAAEGRRLEFDELHAPEGPASELWTLRHALRKGAGTSLLLREAWLRAFGRRAAPLGFHLLQAAEREVEIERRLGPHVYPPLFGGEKDLRATGRRLRSQALEILLVQGLEAQPQMGAWVMEQAAERWPAQLSHRTLLDLTRLIPSKVRLSETAPPLPARRDPVSFLRGLHAVGAWARRAAMEQALPFVARETPSQWECQAGGYTYALLPLSMLFLSKRLGVARSERDRMARALRLALVDHLRVLVGAVEIWSAARSGVAFGREAAEEVGLQLFPEGWSPDSVAGFLLRHSDREARLAGLLVAAAEHQRWVLTYDEDWFDSPRAVEHFWENWKLPATPAPLEASLQEGAAALLGWAAELT
jgi:hypothetical protein